MWHLANAGDGPAVRMVQRVADLAFHHAAWIIRLDKLQAVGAAVLLAGGKLDFCFMVPVPGAANDREVGAIRFSGFDHALAAAAGSGLCPG